jgi:putative hydrolases of HD superfamily
MRSGKLGRSRQSDTDFNPYWKDRKLNMVRKAATTDISNTIQFVLEIDKLKGVLRKVRLIWEERYENVAEHSWQIALFAMSMARTLELKVDVTHVVAMLLVHDLGEIDAGDRFVFAQDGWEERKAAELRALWNASVG